MVTTETVLTRVTSSKWFAALVTIYFHLGGRFYPATTLRPLIGKCYENLRTALFGKTRN